MTALWPRERRIPFHLKNPTMALGSDEWLRVLSPPLRLQCSVLIATLNCNPIDVLNSL